MKKTEEKTPKKFPGRNEEQKIKHIESLEEDEYEELESFEKFTKRSK